MLNRWHLLLERELRKGVVQAGVTLSFRILDSAQSRWQHCGLVDQPVLDVKLVQQGLLGCAVARPLRKVVISAQVTLERSHFPGLSLDQLGSIKLHT